MSVAMHRLIKSKGEERATPEEPYWTLYIAGKHSTEVVVLLLELFVSTAIKSYDNSRVTVRTVPKISNRPAPKAAVELTPAYLGVSSMPLASSSKANDSTSSEDNKGSTSTNSSRKGASAGYSYQTLPPMPIEFSNMSEATPILTKNNRTTPGSRKQGEFQYV